MHQCEEFKLFSTGFLHPPLSLAPLFPSSPCHQCTPGSSAGSRRILPLPPALIPPHLRRCGSAEGDGAGSCGKEGHPSRPPPWPCAIPHAKLCCGKKLERAGRLCIMGLLVRWLPVTGIGQLILCIGLVSNRAN